MHTTSEEKNAHAPSSGVRISKRNLLSFALLVLLAACSKPLPGIEDLCPVAIDLPVKAREVTDIVCESAWPEGSAEESFCDWFNRIDGQQEELRTFHYYRTKKQ